MFLGIISPLFAQQEKFSNGESYSTKRKTLSQMLALSNTSQANHNAYCLIKYRNDRFKATLVGLGSMVLGGTTLFLNERQNSSFATYIDPQTHIKTYKSSYPNFLSSPAGYVAIASGFTGIASIIMFIAAESWISQNNIVFTNNGGVAYRF